MNKSQEVSAADGFARVKVVLGFTQSGYIGLPYWPERNELINMSKDVNPRLGEAKKQAALNLLRNEVFRRPNTSASNNVPRGRFTPSQTQTTGREKSSFRIVSSIHS